MLQQKFHISKVYNYLKRKTVKLTLDSGKLNKPVYKNKYQLPNIDNLIDTIQQNLSRNQSNETAYFSAVDLKYA